LIGVPQTEELAAHQNLELRPRRAGELVDVAFRLTKHTIRTTWPVLLAVIVPSAVLLSLNQNATWNNDDFGRVEASAGSQSGLSLLVLLAFGFVLLATVPGMYGIHSGLPLRPLDSAKRGLRRAPVVVVYAIVTIVLTFLLLIPLLLVFGIVMFIVGTVGNVGGTPVAVAVAVVGWIALLVAWLGLFSRFQLGYIALVLEDIGPFEAITRGWKLSAGRWLQFGAMQGAVFLLTYIVVILVLVLGVYLKRFIEGSVGVVLASFAGYLVSMVWWGPMYTALGVAMYTDSRVRKEALDLNQLSSQLSSAPTFLS
jgi:hypothetical protein